MRTAQRHLGLSIITMDGHHDLTVMTLLMFMPIEPTPLLGQPFPKCCAFHDAIPLEEQKFAMQDIARASARRLSKIKLPAVNIDTFLKMVSLAITQQHSRRPPAPTSAEAVRRALERSQLYSEELGIDLASRSDADFFRWFLASLLFGGRISETIAKNTYRSFIRHGLSRPQKILDSGWAFLVNPVMREGGYVRYDGRKSTQVLHDCEMLIANYGGSLRRLHATARDAHDVEQRLLDFHGIGPVTANIFLREMRPFWVKANPDPLPCVKQLAKRLGIDLARYRRRSLTFVRVEAGLIRRRHDLHRRLLSKVPSPLTAQP